MKVLLFGVTCVGKTTVGEALSKRLGWAFYDLDAEINNPRVKTRGMRSKSILYPC